MEPRTNRVREEMTGPPALGKEVMISVKEALGHIDRFGLSPRTESVSLAEAQGRVLAEKVMADRDGPPFDRVAMDGIAIAYDSLKNGAEAWPCEGLQAAGSPTLRLKSSSSCLEAMTGATLPEGTDTVIPFEHLHLEGEQYRLVKDGVKAGQNIHVQGQDYHEGETLLEPPRVIRSTEVAVAASVGMTDLKVFRPTRLALVTTGSELVDVEDNPLSHQIRKSNVHASASALRQRGYTELSLHHLEDDAESTKQGLEELIEGHDVLILSGGVSKGKLDFVPGALEACGIEKVFHRIAQKPGKPLWFGEGRGTIVFACPGNPVSMLVCLERYVLPFLDKSMGKTPHQLYLPSLKEMKARPNMTLFKTVALKATAMGTQVIEVKGNGSGDFSHLCEGDGFIEVPPSDQPWPSATPFRYWAWT